MRIALILHGWPPDQVGGTGLYVEALAAALADEGHRVSTLAPLPSPAHPGPPVLTPARAVAGTRATVLRCAPPSRWEQSWRRPDLDGLVRGWLARERPDVVHVHHLSHGSLGWLAAARGAGAGLVLTLHDYALPCARGQLVDRDLRPCPGPAADRCAACLGEHLALSPGTAALGRALARWPALRQRLRPLAAPPGPPSPQDRLRAQARLDAVAAALAQPHRLLSPSRDLAARFAALGLRRPEPFDLPLLRPIPPAPPPGRGPLRLLFASAVLPTKGAGHLLAAFRRLPPGRATLTFAGPAPAWDGREGWARALEARARATPGVTWRGALPADAVPSLLAAHDVLVLPSTWPENSPLVVREATAAGLRVVLPAQGGARELAPRAPTVPAGDEDALLAALLAEVERGRGRLPPTPWPTPREHARALEREVYRPLAGRWTE
ncbi:glycosyltransferase [Myxococcota bacterium]|nr:glycosyltransferase [Myxococcota bacterium]